MLFSLDRQVTKIPNAKHQMSAEFFCCFQIWKENRTAGIFSFQFETTTKNFDWHLVLSIWFLVIGRSNEKNIKCISTFRGILIIKTPAWNDRNMKCFKCIHCNICSIHYKRVNIAKKDATYFLGKKKFLKGSYEKCIKNLCSVKLVQL